MYNVRCKMCYFMWYILLATAFIFVLDATTGLQHGILLQILLSFTLIFHLWSIMKSSNRGMLNLKILCCFVTSQTKNMFVDTKYKNGKQILY